MTTMMMVMVMMLLTLLAPSSLVSAEEAGEETETMRQTDTHVFNFTVDYFSNHIESWRTMFLIEDNTAYSILEVGSLEGRATTWMLEHFLPHSDSRMTCVDTWEGSEEHTEELKTGLYERFLHNISPYKHKVDVFRGPSGTMLKDPRIQAQKFDFIYIDACHRARNVLEDAVLAFPLLKLYGALVFDDYLWGPNPYSQSIEEPKAGIDMFMRLYAGSYSAIVGSRGHWQMVLQKTAE